MTLQRFVILSSLIGHQQPQSQLAGKSPSTGILGAWRLVEPSWYHFGREGWCFIQIVSTKMSEKEHAIRSNLGICTPDGLMFWQIDIYESMLTKNIFITVAISLYLLM
jgi:hypothetical protein